MRLVTHVAIDPVHAVASQDVGERQLNEEDREHGIPFLGTLGD